MEGFTLTVLSAASFWIGRKMLQQNLGGAPSASVEDYVKIGAVTTGGILLWNYLVGKKIIPKTM